MSMRRFGSTFSPSQNGLPSPATFVPQATWVVAHGSVAGGFIPDVLPRGGEGAPGSSGGRWVAAVLAAAGAITAVLPQMRIPLKASTRSVAQWMGRSSRACRHRIGALEGIIHLSGPATEAACSSIRTSFRSWRTYAATGAGRCRDALTSAVEGIADRPAQATRWRLRSSRRGQSNTNNEAARP